MIDADAGHSRASAFDPPFRSFFRYATTGAIGTGAHFGVLLCLAPTLGATVSSTLGAVMGCGINYGLARYFVFGSNQPHQVSFPRFAAVALLCVSLNAMVFDLSNQRFSIIASQLVASLVVLMSGFMINLKWTFNGR